MAYITTLDIKEPGLNALPPGVERYIVEAGGLTGIQILPDDEIEIINNEGNQICEISVFNKDGKSELSILSLKEFKDNTELLNILDKDPSKYNINTFNEIMDRISISSIDNNDKTINFKKTIEKLYNEYEYYCYSISNKI